MSGAFSHFVFVDFENVPEVDLSAISSQPVHVTLLIGKNQKKIDLELTKQLMEFTAQVEIVEVGATGRNALDLTLACYLGRALERAPAANFSIVSKDKDFAPMIGHLLAHDVEVARYDSFTALPFLHHRKPVVPPKNVIPTKLASAKSGGPAKKPPEDRSAKVMNRLKNPLNPNRPATRKALLAHLKTSLGTEASEVKVDQVFHQLCDDGILAIDANGKVFYAENA